MTRFEKALKDFGEAINELKLAYADEYHEYEDEIEIFVRSDNRISISNSNVVCGMKYVYCDTLPKIPHISDLTPKEE